MLREFLTFQPIYQERVWGGQALGEVFGRRLPGGQPIGESWEIVDRPEAQSVVAAGPLAGRTLRMLVAGQGPDLMGPDWPQARPFPLLVKWLDCRERLSLQVHPPAAVAAELAGEAKTENWYIAESAHGAQLIVGLKAGVSRAQFEQALAAGTVEECVRRFPVAVGDSVLVRSGELHAIDGGSLILEIQQNSDTTYRVHDWGRTGLDGKPRALQIEQSLRAINWNAAEAAACRADLRSDRRLRVLFDPAGRARPRGAAGDRGRRPAAAAQRGARQRGSAAGGGAPRPGARRQCPGALCRLGELRRGRGGHRAGDREIRLSRPRAAADNFLVLGRFFLKF